MISTECDCKEAANAIPYASYNGTVMDANFPKGCFLYDSGGLNVYWNSHLTGFQDQYSRVVCQSGNVERLLNIMHYNFSIFVIQFK